MTDDIVARLRSNTVSQQYQLQAALIIEELQQQISKLQASGDDLVARLRELERDLLQEEDLTSMYYIPVIGEAADEIQRLRELTSREASNGRG